MNKPRLRKFRFYGKIRYQVVIGTGRNFRILANAAEREAAIANLIGWSSREVC